MAHLDSTAVDIRLSTDMGSLTAVGVYDVDVQPKEKSKCTKLIYCQICPCSHLY